MNYDLPLFKNTEKNGTGFIPVSEEQYNRTRELLIRLLTPMDESERLNFSRVTQNFLNLYKDVIDANNISPVYVASMFVLASPGLDLNSESHRDILMHIFAASKHIDISAIQERIRIIENQLAQFKDIGIQMNLIKETEKKAAQILKKQKDKLYFSKKKLLSEKEEAMARIKNLETIVEQLSSDTSLVERKKILHAQKKKLYKETEKLKNKLDLLSENKINEKKLKRVIKHLTIRIQQLTEDKIHLTNDIQGMKSKEEFARKQMDQLSEELDITNSHGSNYINKLENLEKEIIKIDENLSSLESSSIPEHVVQEVRNFPKQIERYKNQLKTIEYISGQIAELERHIDRLKSEQNSLNTFGDRAEEVKNIRDKLNDTRLEMERLRGRAESYEEGKKQLANNRCPILEITCTTIDEPVEDFFDKKLAVVRVELKTLEKLEKALLNKLAVFEEEQKSYREWQNIESKIRQTRDLLAESAENLAEEEKKLQKLKFGDQSIQIYTLLENIFSGKEMAGFQKTIIRLGTLPDDDKAEKRVKHIRRNLNKVEENWDTVFTNFNNLVNEKDNKLGFLTEKKRSLLAQKEQIKEEYTIICRQAENIESRRKEISKVLFTVEKNKTLSRRLTTAGKLLKKYGNTLKRLEKSLSEIEEKKIEISYLKKEIKGNEKKLSELEAAISEISALQREALDASGGYDKDELSREISALRKKIEDIDDKIILLIEQRELIDQQNAIYLVSPGNAGSSNENTRMLALADEKEKLVKKLYQIDGQFTEFLSGLTEKKEPDSREKIKLYPPGTETLLEISSYMLKNLFWKRNKHLSVVYEDIQIQYWCGKPAEEKPDFLWGPAKLIPAFEQYCK